MNFLFSLILLISFSVPAFASVVMTTTEGTATTTSTMVLDVSQTRRYLLIQNKGDEDLYVKTQTAHGAGEEGVVIIAKGNWEPIEAPIDRVYLKASTGTLDYTIVTGK